MWISFVGFQYQNDNAGLKQISGRGKINLKGRGIIVTKKSVLKEIEMADDIRVTFPLAHAEFFDNLVRCMVKLFLIVEDVRDGGDIRMNHYEEIEKRFAPIKHEEVLITNVHVVELLKLFSGLMDFSISRDVLLVDKMIEYEKDIKIVRVDSERDKFFRELDKIMDDGRTLTWFHSEEIKKMIKENKGNLSKGEFDQFFKDYIKEREISGEALRIDNVIKFISKMPEKGIQIMRPRFVKEPE